MLVSERKSRRRTLSNELIALDAGAGFAVRFYHGVSWPLFWHRHPELELTWIIKGHGTRYVSDSVQRFSDGDLILLGSGVPHTWTSDPAMEEMGEALVAQFSIDVLGKSWRDGSETRMIAGLFDRSLRGVQVLGRTAELIKPIMRQMLDLRPGPLRLGLLLTMLGHLVAAPASDVVPVAKLPAPDLPGVRSDDPWSNLVRHLYEHAGDMLSITGLAVRMRMSPASFARGFRRRFGCTATDYLTQVRLALVCRQLVESERPIADIAFGAGFGNLANFNRRFRRFHGTTPGEWRRQQLGGGAP